MSTAEDAYTNECIQMYTLHTKAGNSIRIYTYTNIHPAMFTNINAELRKQERSLCHLEACHPEACPLEAHPVCRRRTMLCTKIHRTRIYNDTPYTSVHHVEGGRCHIRKYTVYEDTPFTNMQPAPRQQGRSLCHLEACPLEVCPLEARRACQRAS